MRHNSNSRRPRNNRGNGSNGGGNRNNNNNNNNRRVNPRVQTFDSNGPDVRVRGTAYQINEKYITLARDAASAGDRVLAESCLQHAEHYQRFINEMTEKYEQQNQHNSQQQQRRVEQNVDGEDKEVLEDLDQGFLVGDRESSAGNKVESNQGTDDNEVSLSSNVAEDSSDQEEEVKKARPVRRPRKSAAVAKESPELA